MPGGDEDIYTRIVNKLDQNGTVGNNEWRTLVLLALVDLGRNMQTCKFGLADIQTRVTNLEHNSIMLYARKHSKTTMIVFIALGVLATSTIMHLGLGSWLMDLLEIPPLP